MAAATYSPMPMPLAIADLKPEVAAVAPQIGGQEQITAGGENTNTSVVGTSTSYPAVQKWDIGEGSFFTQDDVSDNSNAVAVLGTTTASTLFPDSDAVGQKRSRWAG